MTKASRPESVYKLKRFLAAYARNGALREFELDRKASQEKNEI